MARSFNKANRDWYLNFSRAKPLVAQPDMFYRNFVYKALHNHLYHMDFDCIVYNKNGIAVAIMEQIKCIGRPITPL